MDEREQIKQLRTELHKLNDEYRTAILYRDGARSDSVRLYYTNKMEQLDMRINYLADRIGALV